MGCDSFFLEESRHAHGPVDGRTLSAEHDAMSVVPNTPEKQEPDYVPVFFFSFEARAL